MKPGVRVFKFVARVGVAVGATCVGSALYAQSAPENFTGPYVGLAAGAVDHHFVAVETDSSSEMRQFNVTRWAVGGEAFAGYDIAIAPRIVLGGELQLEFGGRSAITQNADYVFGFKPRFGLSASGRAGYVVASKALIYAGAGYGDHEYRAFAAGNVSPGAADGLDRTRSFILRAGAEWAVSRRAHVRIEFEHLDGTRNQFMVGVPIRF